MKKVTRFMQDEIRHRKEIGRQSYEQIANIFNLSVEDIKAILKNPIKQKKVMDGVYNRPSIPEIGKNKEDMKKQTKPKANILKSGKLSINNIPDLNKHTWELNYYVYNIYNPATGDPQITIAFSKYANNYYRGVAVCGKSDLYNETIGHAEALKALIDAFILDKSTRPLHLPKKILKTLSPADLNILTHHSQAKTNLREIEKIMLINMNIKQNK